MAKPRVASKEAQTAAGWLVDVWRPPIPGAGIEQHEREAARTNYRIPLAQFRLDDLEELHRQLSSLSDSARSDVLSTLRIPLSFSTNGYRYRPDLSMSTLHFHDLRHHGATMALNKGFTEPIVMQLGGWKTEKMIRRYAAVTDAALRAAAEAVSGSEILDSLAEAPK